MTWCLSAVKDFQMYKLVLGAFISFMLVMHPASAARADAGVKVSKTKKAKVGKHHFKRRDVATRATAAPRNQVIRRTVVINGKRKTIYQRVIVARSRVEEPPRLSMGDRAGLNLTRDPLDLASSVALVLDQNNAEVLFEKNANVALPIASITKLMTGLIVVEAQQDMNEILTVTDDDVDHEKFTSSRLRVGSQMTRANLLHIALMSSENRAAAALGRNYPGGVAGFVAAMNAKAQELGMSDTRYVDSSGLSSRNVASARDLAKLAMVAYHQPLLRLYSTDPKSEVDAGGRIMNYHNTNYLVASPNWEIGLQKTGFINEAGRCLVMQAMIQGRAVIMVFLDSKGKQSRTADAGRVKRWLEAMTPAALSGGTTAQQP
jgi:D-alanyl-D-alanine endopeptidase (penicillin-binding protein 7)